MWRWADVKMSRCERRCERRYEERWADERRCERRCERRYEDEQMWEKMWRWERCEDEQLWEKMWRWADVKMSRCEDEKVWRWEGEIQTPTIGRTLRSDALGNMIYHYCNRIISVFLFFFGDCWWGTTLWAPKLFQANPRCWTFWRSWRSLATEKSSLGTVEPGSVWEHGFLISLSSKKHTHTPTEPGLS